MVIPGIPIGWTDKSGGILGPTLRWLQTLVSVANDAPQQVGSVPITTPITAQSAAIAATPVPLAQAQQTAGLYRAIYSLDVLTPASISSSLTAMFGWTYNGVSRSVTGAELTSNLTSSQQGGTVVMAVDASTPITYAVAYASVGTAMTYSFALSVEQLP